MTKPTEPPPAPTPLWAELPKVPSAQPIGMAAEGTAVAIPTLWTPEQALAVFELLDELRDKIWSLHADQIQALLSEEQQHPDPGTRHNPSSDDPSF